MNNNYIYNNVRIVVLKENILRFEYSPSGQFSNEETLFTAKKKEANFSLDVHQEDRIWFKYLDFIVVFDYDNPLKSLEIYRNNQRIYKYKPIRNSGELPLPNKTPIIFPIMDSPRLILPLEGYGVDSKYIYEKDTKDLFLLFSDGDYKKLRKQYISLTGTNDMPRIKTFGLFNSRYYAWNEKSAKEMIEKYRKHHIPLDNFVLDTDWRMPSKTNGSGYEINTKLFPNLMEFYRYAHNHNIEIIMNDHPAHAYKKYNVLSKEEIIYRKENLTKYFVMGLDSWWYDRNWIVSLKSISKRIPAETFGRYIYHDITKQFYQGLVLDPEVYVRPVSLSNITEVRNGTYEKIKDSKSHTIPFQWSGDIGSDSSIITNEIKNMKRCANNMVAYYSSDIGGHTSNPSKNEFIRWYQYGAFSPILRPHATCDVIRFREPWVFGEKTLEIVKEYIYMRYRLLNVIYTNAYKNYLDGLAIFKPLYLNYPFDKRAYKEITSYMLGDNILISPIGGASFKSLKAKNYRGIVYASFYEGRELKGKPILKKKLKEVNFVLNNEKLYPEVPMYDFSACYKLHLRFDQDVDLYVASDDGVRLFVNDKKVYEDWTNHGTHTANAASLKKGVTYKIKIEYYQAGGGAVLQLFSAPTIKNRKTKIYLPEGEWYNLTHRNVYQGNRYIKEKYDIDELPLFVKAGSLLPLYKNVDNISKMNLKNVIYDYYPSRKLVTEDYFYEDDGVTTGYKVGLYRLSSYRLEFKGDHYLVTLRKSENNLDDHLEFRNVMFKIHVRDGEIINKITVNDEPMRFKRHDHNSKIYPFSNSEWSSDSKSCCFKFRQDIKKEYHIKIFVKE